MNLTRMDHQQLITFWNLNWKIAQKSFFCPFFVIDGKMNDENPTSKSSVKLTTHESVLPEKTLKFVERLEKGEKLPLNYSFIFNSEIFSIKP
ncbi:CLUMA_CG006370, isoform A [Clunio marinus]|uniref:CLUMA_CG006370, isoform A n=1 Tax=Clunio marinus TaxID=568069 RepID=A0A1J1HZR4_9DIPT|nr:CLUMA_CG006370, isoform A [Clunio marinus]